MSSLETDGVAMRHLEEMLTDPLTKLGNRRKLSTDVEGRLAEASASAPLVLALFDLDGFKGYNDTFGHLAGDALLTRLAAKLKAAVDEQGSAYRLGGDEFCVLLNAPRRSAHILAPSVGHGRSAGRERRTKPLYSKLAHPSGSRPTLGGSGAGGTGPTGEDPLFVIVVVALSVLVVAALFAIGLARAAASGDEAMDRLLAERRRELSEEAERTQTLPARERIVSPRSGPFSSRAVAPPSPEAAAADDRPLVGSRAWRRRRRRTPAA